MSFWGELKRRNVFKVGVAYIIAAWLIVQVANTFFPILHLPDWSVTLVAVLLILGLPIALIFAWAYEMTPDGVKLTKKVPLAESITHFTGRKLNYVLAGVIVLALAYILFDNLYLDRRVVETETNTTEAEQPPINVDTKEAPKTIAVLPFDNLSPEKDQAYFVDGLSEEIINSLCQIPDLGVSGKTSSFSFKGKDKTIQEIASVLGVDHILEGSVRTAGNTLRITAQLVRASDGLHLWSETYDRELRDIFKIQEDIANSVADKLKLTLEAFNLVGGTDNVEAYELYLVAQGQTSGDDYESYSNAIKSLDAAIELDDEFALAWAKKAHYHIRCIITGTAIHAHATDEGLSALKAAERAIELEPNLAYGYSAIGWIKMLFNFIEAENYYHKSLELRNKSLSGEDEQTAVYYNTVGYFKKAFEVLDQIRRNDPVHKSIRGHYILNFAFRGDTKGAEEEYQLCRATFGDWSWHNMVITNIRLGIKDALSQDKIVYSDPIFNAVKMHLDSPEEGIAVLRQLYADRNNLSFHDLINIAILAAHFDDPKFAMDIIENIGNMLFWIWLPVFQDVRQLPQFKEYVMEIGLVDYWNEFGWPDICRPLENGDFVCD